MKGGGKAKSVLMSVRGGVGMRGICPEVIIPFPQVWGMATVLRKVLVSCYQHSLSDLVVFSPRQGLGCKS